MNNVDKFVKFEMAKLAIRRIDITPSVRSKEDLFRYLEKSFDKRNVFFYFKRNAENGNVWEEIGKLAGLHKSKKHWEAFLPLGGSGVISWSGRIMLVTSGESHFDKGLHMKELRLERCE